MKSSVKSVVVLSAICVVIAAVLAVTNKITGPIIDKNNAAAENKALTVVMPNAKGFEQVELANNTPETVQKLYKETSGLGYVVVLSTKSQYSSDNMGIIVAIGTDGKISGVTITGYYESKDFGKDTYPQTYVGADSALNGVDTFAGVTYSSTAFKNAISDAFAVLVSSGAISEGQKSLEQTVKDMIPTILPGAVDASGAAKVTETTVAGFDMAFEAKNGCGYVLVSGEDVYAVNAFGDVKCYGLDGKEKTPSKTVAGDTIAKQNEEKNLKRVKALFGDDAVATALTSAPAFGAVTGGFKVEFEGATYYVFNTKGFGYEDLMEMTVAVGSDGKVVKYKNNTDFIQEAEYYTTHGLTDQAAYINSLLGLDAKSDIDSASAITGATITSKAVASALKSALQAYNAVAK